MRTDSTSLSTQAVNAARSYIKNEFGISYLPQNAKIYRSKSANAQEAHEAIRPAGNSFINPNNVNIGENEKKLYTLIFNRTIASQMADAKGETITTLIKGKNTNTVFSATGSVVTFEGFYKILNPFVSTSYTKNFKNNDVVYMNEIAYLQHQTQPPARFNQGSLIAKLEELGIGRPSTYATIMSTIFDRGYVYNIGSQAIAPAWLGFGIVQLLENYFKSLVEYDFTAELEDDLDKISNGKIDYKTWLNWFYFGKDKFIGLKNMVTGSSDKIDFETANTIKLTDKIDVRVGKTYPYMIIHDDKNDVTASIPDNIPPDELQNVDISKLKSNDEPLGVDPKTKGNIFLKVGRFGPYITLLDNNGDNVKNNVGKPINISLLKSMTVDTFSYDDALKLLQLPKKIGIFDGKDITSQNGRYGPYLKCGTKMVSLKSEDEMFTITEDEAIKKLNDPKTSNNVELGVEQSTGKKIFKKRGFYGPYITDGTVNVTIKGNEDISLEEAIEKIVSKRKNPTSKFSKRKTKRKKKII
jgi:DNA topoisomerase-1